MSVKEYHCPLCGGVGIPGVEHNMHRYYCTCGMVWTQTLLDNAPTTNSNKRDEIENALKDTIVAYMTRNPEVNRERLQDRAYTIKWLSREIMKGPILGGTLADIPHEVARFGGDVWEAERKAILIRDDMCMICGERPSKEVHHIRPRHLNGRNHPRNLIGLCLECHDEVHRKIDNGIQMVLEESLSINILKAGLNTLDNYTGGEDAGSGM